MVDGSAGDEGPKARKSPVQASIAKALFFFEKGGAADGPGADAKWPEWRQRYLKRGEKLEKILQAQGLALGMRGAEAGE